MDIYGPNRSQLSIKLKRALNFILCKRESCLLSGLSYEDKHIFISRIKSVLEKSTGNNFAITSHTEKNSADIGSQTLCKFIGVYKELLDKPIGQIILELLKNKYKCSLIQQIKTLIIDEIHLVNTYVFEVLDKLLQSIRKDSRPFGGIQLILIGEFFFAKKSNVDEQFIFQKKSFLNCVSEVFVFEYKNSVHDETIQNFKRGVLSESVKNLIRNQFFGEKKFKDIEILASEDEVKAKNLEEYEKLAGEEQSFKIRHGCYESKSESKRSALIKNLLKNLGVLDSPPPLLGGLNEDELKRPLKDFKIKEKKFKIGSRVYLTNDYLNLKRGKCGTIVGWKKIEEENLSSGGINSCGATSSFSSTYKNQKNKLLFVLFPCSELVPLVQFDDEKEEAEAIAVPYFKYTMRIEDTEVYAWDIGLEYAWAISKDSPLEIKFDSVAVDLNIYKSCGMAASVFLKVRCLSSLKITNKDFAFENVFRFCKEISTFYEIPFLMQKSIHDFKESLEHCKKIDTANGEGEEPAAKNKKKQKI